MTDEELLNLAARLAGQAAQAIREIRAAGFSVERKADDTPVTLADRTAEALIVKGLRAATPGIPVVAEEEVAAGHSVALAERYWLVDPLDGTRDFAGGHDSFAVNVGLVEGDRAHLGAVALPATEEIFAGIVPAGMAWKEDAAGRRPIRARAVPEGGAVVMASRHHGDDPRLDRFLEGRRVAEIHKIGSAVKFCRLAEGAGDLYPRFGRTMEWDTAAPQAVLEAAGGRVAGFDGAPLRYRKPRFENHAFLATGAP
ncbi:3'(2'),5'-bisphosphate nucleotidase CysQ [Roseomonas sp. CCTCC AB2023176]|uniref:3'(2'),5'-bisphosphate nucleotidase CysQ family protein n=1 Tax=Roseomonas sp. CCTCC AB2023176 TaxID=3342640 RepID=UPI0035DF8C03